MNEEEAGQIARLLAWKVGVKAPTFRAMRRTGYRENYRPRERAISMQRTGIAEWVLLHEMAHHVTEERRPKLTKAERAQLRAVWRRDGVARVPIVRGWGSRQVREERIVHGPAFVAALVELIEAWRFDYPWAREYRCVKAEARRRGLLSVE